MNPLTLEIKLKDRMGLRKMIFDSIQNVLPKNENSERYYKRALLMENQ